MRSADRFPSKYLKSDDLKGRKVTLTISHLVTEDVGNPPEPKSVVYFKETEKGLVLNKTNDAIITYINGGDDESDHWAGIRISLVAEMKSFQGKPIMGLSVKPPQDEPKPAPAPARPTTARGVTRFQPEPAGQKPAPLDPDDDIPF